MVRGSLKSGFDELAPMADFDVHRKRLIEFIQKYCPSKLPNVDALLEEWSGREDELLSVMSNKYELPASEKEKSENEFNLVIQKIKTIYTKSIRPLEELYKFDSFFSPLLEDADIEAKPMVLMLGSYSVGKTSFIKFLVERDFPGMRVGPEPTTDRFVCVMHGDRDQIIPGNALCVSSDRPFQGLNKFGAAFLNRMEASLCNSRFLESITLIDTPGVLAGEKQRIGRQYNFTNVVEWFAERCDRILLIFDAHKLDISDEFKRSIEALRGHDEKVRVVLNKADSVSPKQLMRVYGALMWSLGKVVNTPEVLRVYIGSFWDKPLNQSHENFHLFESEALDLISDLKSLPRNSAIRKINELVKRARMARVHAYIISHLKSLMPSLWGGSKKQRDILANLSAEFTKIAAKHKIPFGDFPNVDRFRELMGAYDLSKMPKLHEKAIARLDHAISVSIPQLLQSIRIQDDPTDFKYNEGSGEIALSPKNPFDISGGTADLKDTHNMTGGFDVQGWSVSMIEKTASDNIFYSSKLSPDGMLKGDVAREALARWGLPNDILFKVWKLADIDQNNQLDCDEFAVAVHLMNKFRNGDSLPDSLPRDLVPPSKRR